MTNKEDKIVVFDLDETMGYFSQLYILWKSLINLSETRLSSNDFYVLSEIYKFYYHPEIINVLKYLKENNIKPIIYTNNQALFWWPKLISLYLSQKINIMETRNMNKNTNINTNINSNQPIKNIFQDVIGAYTINGYYNEHRRTSNYKKYSDLKGILKAKERNRNERNRNEKNEKILFIDDQEHPEMRHKNVVYIKPPQYIIVLPAKTIINTFLHSTYGKNFIIKNKINTQFFINYIFNELKRHGCLSVKTIKIYKNINLLGKIKNFVENESDC